MERTSQTIVGTLVLLFILSCASLSWQGGNTGNKGYSKSFQDRDFLFRWKYDFSQKDFILIRGKAKNIDGFTFERIALTITGLDEKSVRLGSGGAHLMDLKINETDTFEVKIPKEGKEKSFLFQYDYEFFLEGAAPFASPTGPNPMTGWFLDTPDPNVIPEAVHSPPGY